MHIKKLVPVLFYLFCFMGLNAQNSLGTTDFWDRVRFGGGLGLGFTNGGFNGTISPSAIYEFNSQFAAGTSLNLSYAKFDNDKFLAYGGSVLGLYNPLIQLQLSAEFEQLRINRSLDALPNPIEDDYWLPALFLGIGYRTNNVTFGLRYDVLYDNTRSIYANNLMPFVRFFF